MDVWNVNVKEIVHVSQRMKRQSALFFLYGSHSFTK